MSRIAAMEFILGAYSPSRAEGSCRLVVQKERTPADKLQQFGFRYNASSRRLANTTAEHLQLRSLRDYEVVRAGDIVEDLETGSRELVGKGYYGFLSGYPAGTAKQMPAVHDVLRPL